VPPCLPLLLVTMDALSLLTRLGKLPPDSELVRTLREHLTGDLSAAWATFRRQRAQRQAGLGLGLPGELGLGGAWPARQMRRQPQLAGVSVRFRPSSCFPLP